MEITLTTKDWLFNAGLSGFINIISANAEKKKLWEIKNNSFTFDIKVLEHFEDDFFNFFIKRYKNVLTFSKLISSEKIIDDFLEAEKYSEEEVLKINDIIDFFKSKLKLNSFISAYDYIKQGLKDEILSDEKKLKKIKIDKKGNFSNEEVENNLLVLKKTISKIKTKEKQRNPVAAKNVAYSVINRAWNNVSFFNPSKTANNIFEEYKEYFVKPAIDFLNENKSKMTLSCSLTGVKMKYSKKSIAFLNDMGYDIAKKTSHGWKHHSEIVISPLAILIYSCIPAGFTYLFNSGIFVNANSDLNELIRINNAISYKVLEEKEKISQFIESIIDELGDCRYEISDIQVIRLENLKYKFQSLSKEKLKKLADCKNELQAIKNKYYKNDKNEYCYLYDLVDAVIEGKQLKQFLNFLCRIYVLRNSNLNYSSDTLFGILKINTKIERKVKISMEEKKKEINELYYIRQKGIEFRTRYVAKSGNDKKIETLTFKLLESLRSGDIKKFMDEILSVHMYAGIPVESAFVKAISDEKAFYNAGYAFVIGILGKNNKKEGEDNEE